MFFLDPSVKADPHARWHLSNRIFFSNGACHILAGVYLKRFNTDDVYAVWIKPASAFEGNHIFVTNGGWAMDARGFMPREKLLEHHSRKWSVKHPGWRGAEVRVDFDLLDTGELNQRGMRGADQYLHDPIPRAEEFLSILCKRSNLTEHVTTL